MSNSGQNVKNEAIREVAFGDINATLTALGDPLSHDAFKITLFNDTDANIYISVDGVTDIMKIPDKIGRVSDEKTNDMYRKKDTQFYIRYEDAPTEGAFWLEVEYT
jgi:hypothetical protein